MDLKSFRRLLTSAGQEALEAAMALEPREADFLRHFAVLSRRFPADLARAALETAVLRGEAAAKFPSAGRMYFTRAALEQASSHEVAAYRVQRFRPYSRLVDLGCSIGGDTLALAALSPTLGIDLDTLRLEMARANLRLPGLERQADFVLADLLSPLPFTASPSLALFFDPARRTAERRIFSVRDYQPPLHIVDGWIPRFPALGVKISPGVKMEELEPFDAEVEFISLRGELKEAVLWFGPLRSAGRRATVLPGPFTLTGDHSLKKSIHADSLPGHSMEEQPLPLSEPRAFLYEPDPAVLRAGLVRTLGAQLGADQLDPDIAYLTSDRLAASPFVRAWPVEAWFPFQLKRLRSALRERGVGRVTVKKRGSPLQPETLIRELHLSGDQERVIFLTHLRGRPIVILAFEEQKR